MDYDHEEMMLAPSVVALSTACVALGAFEPKADLVHAEAFEDFLRCWVAFSVVDDEGLGCISVVDLKVNVTRDLSEVSPPIPFRLDPYL